MTTADRADIAQDLRQIADTVLSNCLVPYSAAHRLEALADAWPRIQAVLDAAEALYEHGNCDHPMLYAAVEAYRETQPR